MKISNEIIIAELTSAFISEMGGKTKGVAAPEESFPINVQIKQIGFNTPDLEKIRTIADKYNLDTFIYSEENEDTVTIDLYLGKDKIEKLGYQL